MVHYRLLIAPLILASVAPAAVLVTNFPPNNQGGAGYNVDANSSVALVVTIGATPVRFDSLEAVFNSFCSLDCPYTVEGGIYADVGGAPGALLAPFIDQPLGPLAETIVTFTTAAAFNLSAGATYWFILEAPGVVSSGGEWIDGGEPYTDTVLADALGFNTKVGADPWGPVVEFPVPGSDGNPQAQLNGTAIPEPGTLTLLGFALAGMGLFARRRSRLSR
jgi:hypothetical protein